MVQRKYPDTEEGRLARKQYQRSFRAKNRQRYSDEDRQRKFGITPHEYNSMIAAQNNRCAICECEETATRLGKVKALSVDHNHSSGQVRGLLCSDCNTGIGKLKENRDTLLAAIRYLDKHSGAAKVSKLELVSKGA